MSLFDLLAGRRRAVEELLTAESDARVAAEAELARERTDRKRAEADLAEWVNAYWGEHLQQRERAQNAEAQLARIREGLATCAQDPEECDIATTLMRVILLKDALLVAAEHDTNGPSDPRGDYRALAGQIVARAMAALVLPEHDQLHQGLRDSLRLDRAGVS